MLSVSVFVSHVAYTKEEGKVIMTGENDLALEFSYIASFTHGINQKRGFLNSIALPLSAGDRGQSEYLPCIYTSFLEIGGCSLQVAVFIHSVMLLSSIVLLEFSLTLRMCGSNFGALFISGQWFRFFALPREQ